MRSIEICAGAGGQALGLEQAGFEHVALVEIDPAACKTLRRNRPDWPVIEGDLQRFSTYGYSNIDLLAGGVPCPPFSVAGKQQGAEDERDLFPVALRLVEECHPKAVMLENVKGIFSPKFNAYRASIETQLIALGYDPLWKLIEANHFGVPQKRTRSILLAFKQGITSFFKWPMGILAPPPTVGQLLLGEMKKNGWEGAEEWAAAADDIAPTIVGGSRKHGGPDLGPTRARQSWARLGVDGRGIADDSPQKGFEGVPRLTVKMAGLIQGFPLDWEFVGKKTPAYRQVGNAFPPPVACALGGAIAKAIVLAENSLDLKEEIA